MKTSNYISLSKVTDVQKTSDGLLANLEHEKLRVDVIKSDLVRIKISRGGVFDESPSHAVVADFDSVAANARGFELEIGKTAAILKTNALEVRVALDPLHITIRRTDGSLVFDTALDSAGQPLAYSSLNDAFTLTRTAAPTDAIYGLGEKTGKQNRRGRDFTLWNTDVLNPSATGEFRANRDAQDPRSDQTSTEFDPYYISIPFFYQQTADGKLAGSYIDNPYRAYYDLTGENDYRIHFSGGQYTEYVFAGPDMASILRDYTWLTGRMQLPPIWALGYHQCRWKRYDQQQVIELAKKHRAAGIPVDTLWLDIEYMDEFRVFTWNHELFPDPAAMFAELREMGIRVITIIDPGVKYDPGYLVFDSGLAEDVFCRTEGGDTYIGQVWPGNTAFPDFSKQSGRDWWGRLNAEHVKSGLAGIWNDMNEPATGEIPPERMLFSDGTLKHERVHNEYAMLMAMGTVDGLREVMPALRTFVLSRAGSPGIQRYAANWMGDNMARWDHIWLSLPMGAGLGISGQPFVGADIGGFAEDSSAELFARWIQYGALTPFARNHSAINQVDQYAFSFGPEVLAIAKDALELRYRLLPYIYTSFWQTAETGEPIQRPLVFDYQYDKNTHELDDEYGFGRSLLVAPIYAAKQTSREVYLPAGEWFDWATDERIQGGRSIKAEAPAERIPVFAKAGSVIPMLPKAPQTTADLSVESVQLHVFVPGQDGVFESELVEDDGLTFAASEGAYLKTMLRLERSGSSLVLTGSVSGKGFAEFVRKEFEVVLHGAGSDRGAVILIENGGADFELKLELL